MTALRITQVEHLTISHGSAIWRNDVASSSDMEDDSQQSYRVVEFDRTFDASGVYKVFRNPPPLLKFLMIKNTTKSNSPTITEEQIKPDFGKAEIVIGGSFGNLVVGTLKPNRMLCVDSPSIDFVRDLSWSSEGGTTCRVVVVCAERPL